MAVKDGSGPQPAAQSAKRCFLNCPETSLRPSICPPSCSASFQLAYVLLPLAFVLHGSGQRTVPQGQNTMGVKDGLGPQPAAHTAKRCFLNCLETSLRPSICPRSCSASFQLAYVLVPLAFVLHGSGQRTVPQGQNTMGVKDGLGPQPAAQSAKRCFLNCLETSLRTFHLPAFLHCQLSTCLRPLAASSRPAPAWLWSKDGPAGPKHHGSEGRIGPAAGSPECQTVKDGSGPRPAAQTAKRCFLNCLETSFKPV